MQIRRLSIDDQLCLVDFEIYFNTTNGGSSTILIGENGRGKSTMIETILEIFMSFDSPSIEEIVDYNYKIEYEYAQSFHSIEKSGYEYRLVTDGNIFEGSYTRARAFAAEHSMFPQRIITFYSGANNKMLGQIKKVNNQYKKVCRNTLAHFLRAMNDDTETVLPHFPKRKYNYCDEELTPIYLTSILCGHDTFEKRYLVNACKFDYVEYVDMIINMDKVEKLFGRNRFEDLFPTSLYYLTDFIDHRFTDTLRRGFEYIDRGKAVFSISNIEELNVDSISILEFFEKLHSLFDATFEITVTQGSSSIKCHRMSEGQRQLIKVLGMLGICKTEDCLVLMDEPDAHMNPKWKYEIKKQ